MVVKSHQKTEYASILFQNKSYSIGNYSCGKMCNTKIRFFFSDCCTQQKYHFRSVVQLYLIMKNEIIQLHKTMSMFVCTYYLDLLLQTIIVGLHTIRRIKTEIIMVHFLILFDVVFWVNIFTKLCHVNMLLCFFHGEIYVYIF